MNPIHARNKHLNFRPSARALERSKWIKLFGTLIMICNEVIPFKCSIKQKKYHAGVFNTIVITSLKRRHIF